MERKSSCPSQTALEEYAVALRIGAPEPAVMNHLQACKRCRYRLKSIQKQSDSFLGFLGPAGHSPGSKCPEPVTLAAYLDRSLDPDQKNKIEQHLAVCRPCQQVLKSIYRETDASGARERESEYVPAPVVLADQQRGQIEPAAVVVGESYVEDTADAEPRKERLSSDFD